VDAVVSLGERMIPIDAKFPLENFRRLKEVKSEDEEKVYRKKLWADVRKHVDSIAEKYILPDQGTYDFALMYIPAENVYYETIVNYGLTGDDKSISDYALRKKVIPVSPNTLYAYLQVIVLGLRGLRIDERAQEILAHLASLHGEMEKFRKDFQLVGGHLDNAKNRYEEARIKLSRFADRLTDLESPAEETD
jgi:DNA recombination protein RmuC